MSPMPLNLDGADAHAFDALESGQYLFEVYEYKVASFKAKPDSKLPDGTTTVTFGLRILCKKDEMPPTEDSYGYNRKVFNNFYLPDPKKYDKGKAQNMMNALAGAFVALGFDEKEVVSKEFDPDPEDIKGRQGIVTLGPPNEGSDFNTVRSMKALSDSAETVGGLL